MWVSELVTLTLRQGNLRNPTRMTEALEAIRAFGGEALLGCWTTEFGPQNRILLLRTFPSAATLQEERMRVLHCADPFLPAGMLAAISFESFAPFRGLPLVTPGAYGPYYEFRTYVLKIGGLADTEAAWAKAIPRRTKLSPLVTVMHALDGEPRFIHVWGYRDLGERERIRKEAFSTGVWPAPGAPDLLSERLRNELYVPTAISKLT